MENSYHIEDNTKSSAHVVNYQRLLSRVLKYWYVMVWGLGLALFSVYLINRYAVRIYPVTMSILIKDSQEASGTAEILYNNPLIQGYRNYYNELYIIKSYPLVEDVVETLGFTTSFYKIGNIKTTEVYKTVPVNINFLEGPISDATFQFELLSNSDFELIAYEENDISDEVSVFNFNDTISYNRNKFIVTPLDENRVQHMLNQPYVLRFSSSIDVTKSYIDKLKVEWAEEGASVINLDINGALPEKEIDFMNTLIEFYKSEDLNKKRQTAARSLEFIEEQLSDISDSLLWYEAQLENFKEKNMVVNISDQAEKVLQRIKDLDERLGNINLYDRYLTYLKKHINDKDNANYVVLPVSVGINDPVLIALVNKMVEIQLQINSYTGSQQMSNPFLSQIQRSLENVKGSISESITNIEATNDIEAQEIMKKIKNHKAELAKFPNTESKLITIERNYKFSENLYTFLTQKRAEAGITKASETSDIYVINPAMKARGHISPNIGRNYLIGVVSGLGMPFLLFFLLEYFNNKVQSKEDIEKLSDIPFSGIIGHNPTDSNLVVYNTPKSAISESFRSLRSNLNYFTEGKDKKIFLVTSAISGEGKTFTSINLGTVLAYSAKKTVIVGADMRTPKIFGDFGLTNDKGLSSILSSKEKIKDVIQPTFIENLFLLSAGPVPPNPSEMLMKNEVEEMFEELLNGFDYVILDTPPVGFVTDAFILSKYADHTLFVIRQGVTPLLQVRNIGELYQEGRIKNMSVVLNDIKDKAEGYGYYEI